MTIANTNPGYVNADGLRWKFPADEVVKGTAGEYRANTSTHISEFDLDYATVALGTSDTVVVILDYDSVFPNGSVIEKIELKVGTAWNSAGDAFLLNVGLVARSDFTTITDADGLLNDVDEANLDTAGAVYAVFQEANGTEAGVLLGTALAVDNVLCASWNGAAPSAGTAKMYVHWRVAA